MPSARANAVIDSAVRTLSGIFLATGVGASAYWWTRVIQVNPLRHGAPLAAVVTLGAVLAVVQLVTLAFIAVPAFSTQKVCSDALLALLLLASITYAAGCFLCWFTPIVGIPVLGVALLMSIPLLSAAFG